MPIELKERPLRAARKLFGRPGPHPSKFPGLEIPPLPDLIIRGGDARLACGQDGRNAYGCSPSPEAGILSFSSSTATSISEEAFANCRRVHARLTDAAEMEAPATTFSREMERVRCQLISLYGLNDLSGLLVYFGSSGTDLHRMAVDIFRTQASVTVHPGKNAPLTIVMPEPDETGSHVATALADHPRAFVHGRTLDGWARDIRSVDADVADIVERIVRRGGRALLIVADVSKTGLIFPSPQAALALRDAYPGRVELLIDAAQFRLSPSSLRAYLKAGCSVAVTGSKFVTGPAFSGALFVPSPRSARPRTDITSTLGLLDRTAAPSPYDDHGLLLRFEAALTQMRPFHHLPETAVRRFAERFAHAIVVRMTDDPALEPIMGQSMMRLSHGSDRGTGVPAWEDTECWDAVPTIFPFLLRAASGKLLDRNATAAVYDAMKRSRMMVGQPASVGEREGRPVSALRLCLDMRLIVDAIGPGGRGPKAVIMDAMRVLDLAADLARV